MRATWGVLLLAGAVWPHGGQFRPPPPQVPRDRWQPTRGLNPTTRRTAQGPKLAAWETWWSYNRERYLRLRERLVERLVITGPEGPKDTFDRKALRTNVLIPEVLKALRDEDGEVRMVAAIVAGKLQAKGAVSVLKEMHGKDKDRTVRDAAVVGLVLMRDPELEGWIRALALDAKVERRVRGVAILGLALLEDVAFLEQVLENRVKLRGSGSAVEELRACAALALGYAAAPASLGTLARAALDRQAPRGVRGYAAAACGRLGSPLALPEMLGLLRKKDSLNEARYGAAIAMGGLVAPSDHGILDFLGKKAQRDKDGGVRALLLIALGQIGGDRAATHIVAEMATREQTIRGYCYLAMGISGHKDAGDILFDRFGKISNPTERGACALALGLCGHVAAAPAIRKEVERYNPGFLPHGLLALGLLNDRASVDVVREAIRKFKDPRVRTEGALALALIRGNQAVPELTGLLAEAKSTFARGAIAAALGQIGTDKAAAPLLEMYRDKKRQGTERALALSALGRIGDADRIPALSRYAFDLNPYVTVEAVQVVVSIL